MKLTGVSGSLYRPRTGLNVLPRGWVIVVAPNTERTSVKPNNPSPSQNTFTNRVAQFEKQQKVAAPVAPLKSTPNLPLLPTTDYYQRYVEARSKVLASYPEEDKMAILKMEKNGNTDNREYDRYVCDLLIAAGDEPTHTLRKNTELCGCHSCRGKLEAKQNKNKKKS